MTDTRTPMARRVLPAGTSTADLPTQDHDGVQWLTYQDALTAWGITQGASGGSSPSTLRRIAQTALGEPEARVSWTTLAKSKTLLWSAARVAERAQFARDLADPVKWRTAKASYLAAKREADRAAAAADDTGA